MATVGYGAVKVSAPSVFLGSPAQARRARDNTDNPKDNRNIRALKKYFFIL
jgi:hypothetical protein